MEERLSQSNKGFTLVEIVVTMVIISVLASITTFSLISWNHNSIYNKEEQNAELVYMAVKNKLAIYKANNAEDEIIGWTSFDPDGIADDTLANGETREDLNQFKDIRYMMCYKGDYDKYKTGQPTASASASILFDFIADYINDKKSLNDASICIEFDKENNVVAVFYSDRWEKFDYVKTMKEDPNCIRIRNLKKKPSDRYEYLVGMYMPGENA